MPSILRKRFPQIARFIAVCVSLFLIQGCSGVAQVLSAATTSPGEKTCSIYVDYENQSAKQDIVLLELSGGIAGFDQPRTFMGRSAKYPSGRYLWHFHDARPYSGQYFDQKAPCTATSPMTLRVRIDDRKFQANVPLINELLRPVYGWVHIRINESTVTVSLAENVGKVGYSAPLMSNVWLREPERKVAEARLNEL
jgi:hypothetical protein